MPHISVLHFSAIAFALSAEFCVWNLARLDLN
jgi:hypothetical protein